MAKTQTDNPLAKAFAQSLLDLADAQKQAEPVGQELAGVRQVVEADPSFALFLADPAVGTAEREQIVDRTFGPHVSPLVRNFLKVAVNRGAGQLHPQISAIYDDLLDELLGKVEVDVTVPRKLEPGDLENVRQKVSQAIKKDVVIHQYVDEELIGGIVIRVGDQVIDASVRAQLESMRRKLLSATK